MAADLNQEVRLYDNNTERDRIDNMAELYAMINALECLEKVYSRDYVASNEYTAECSKLLVQIKVPIEKDIKIIKGCIAIDPGHEHR